MNSSIPSSVKKEIHKVLLSNSGGVQLVNFSNEYKQLTGHDLDYSSFGFRSLKELLVSMPDVARVVLVTKCKTEKVYGVAERSQTSMNVSEKKGLGTTKDDKPLLTSNTKDRKGSFSKAGSPKDSLRQFVEKNIKCNRKGLWSLCFLSKKPISNKDVYHIFSPFGPVAEINISKRYAFVRFKTKEDAINAYVHLKEELGLEIASERTCMAEPRMKHDMVQNHSNDASAVHTQQKNDHHIRKGHLDGNHLSNHTKSIGHSIVDKHVRSAIINGLGSYQVSDTIGRGRWKQESLSVSGSSNQTQGAVVARTLNDRISMPELTSTRDDEEFDDMPSLEDIDDVPAFEGDHQQCDEEQISINDQSFNFGTEKDRSHGNLTEHYQGAEKQYSETDSSQQSYPSQGCQGRPYQQEADVFELCVRNFPYGTDTKDLLEPFAIFGASNIKMINNEPGKRTLAFVQFKDYDSAVEAFTCLDDQDFDGRNLQVTFSWNTFCRDDIVYKKLENLKIRVTVESTQVVKDGNGLTKDSHLSRKSQPKVSYSVKQPKQEQQPVLTEEIQRAGRQKQTAKHHQVASQVKPGKLQDCEATGPKLSKSDLSNGLRKIPNQHSVKDIKSGNRSVLCDLHSEEQREMIDSSSDNCIERTHKHYYQGHQIQGSGHAGTPATLKRWSSEAGGVEKKWSSPQNHYFNEKQKDNLETGPANGFRKDMANSMSCGSDVSNKFESLKDHLIDMASSVPLMMRQHIMEQMRKDVCPGCHLLTVDGMLPHINICISYIENSTYFWGYILNSPFKQNLEKLLHLNKLMAEVTHDNTVKGNRASILYKGEWSRVWIYKHEGLTADIMHIDYGNTETVHYSCLSEIPDELWQLPPQAIPFRLKVPSQFPLVQDDIVQVTVDTSAEGDHIITVFK